MLVGIALFYSIAYFFFGSWTILWDLHSYFAKPTIFTLEDGYNLNVKFLPGIGSHRLGIELSSKIPESILYKQIDINSLREGEIDELIIEDGLSEGIVKVSHNKREIVLRK